MAQIDKKEKCSSQVACLVTRPDLNEEMFEMLRSCCTTVDIWSQCHVMPKDELIRRVEGKQALVCTLADNIDCDVLQAAGDLRIVATLSVGFDHIDIDECRRRGIQVANTPGVLTESSAELTIALMMAVSRRLFEAERALRSNEWPTGWNHLWMCGTSISNSTVGIIGLGRIGLAVSKRVASFSPSQILYSGNSEKVEAKAVGAKFVSLETLLAESDFVIVCCALNEKTKGLLNATRIGLMKPSAILINTSRGAIVDQTALVEALKQKKIRGAGLDVFEVEPLPILDPIRALDNVVLLPHIGSAASDTRLKMAILTAQNVLDALEGKSPPGLVV